MWDKDAPQDSYLHSPEICGLEPRTLPTSRWWEDFLSVTLPFSASEARKEALAIMRFSPNLENCDLYQDHYHPGALSIVSDLFPFKEVSHSVRDYMPNCETNFSPFVKREREGKKREETKSSQVKISFASLNFWGNSTTNSTENSKNPSVAGTSSTASNTSNTSDTDEEDLSSSDDFELKVEIAEKENFEPVVPACKSLTFDKLFKTTQKFYGFAVNLPNSADQEIYEKFVKFDAVKKGKSKELKTIKEAKNEIDEMFRPFDYKPHDYTKELLPMPAAEDVKIYKKYIEIGRTGKSVPSKEDVQLYMDYIKKGKNPTKEDWEKYDEYMKLAAEAED